MKKMVFIVILLYPVASFGATYYVSKSGSNTNPGTLSQPWATIQKAAATMVAGDTVYVRAGTYYEQVTPANSGTRSAKITYAAYTGEIPIIDGTGVTPSRWDWGGLFNIGNKSHIVVNGLTIRNAFVSSGSPGVAGIQVDGGSDNVITHCSISNTRSSGISIYNSINTADAKTYVTYNDIQRAVEGGTQEVLTIASSSYLDVSNNKLHNCPFYPDNGREGIDAKESSYVWIHDNIICDFGNTAIYVGGYLKDVSNLYVYNNLIYSGPNYTVPVGIGVSAEEGGTTNNVDIYNNVVRATSYSGIAVYKPITRTAGTFYTNLRIFNNSIYECGVEGIVIYETALSGVQIFNNISASNGTEQLSVASPSNIATSHNLWYGAQGAYKGTSFLTISPAFVSTTDLHLKSTSPAINAGIKGPNTDRDGVARPQGSGYDMGAYEYMDDGSPKVPTGLKIIN